MSQNSRPCFIAHFCSCIIYTSIRICALCSAVCLSQQSSVFSRPLPLPGFIMRCCYWSGCSSIMTPAVWSMQRQTFPWRRLLTPALGGLAAGLLLMGWQKFTQQRPHAPTDYMEALQTDGQFDYAASLVKSLASLLVVTSGSAIGREGAMILLAALAASCFAQRFTPRQEWKLWIACGAAAGMAAAYRAPLAGSLFIAEVLFGTMMLASLGPVIISAVVALLVSNLINHSDALLYNVQLSVTVQARDYALIISTGVLAGLCGPLLLTLMNACHRGFVGLKLAPPWQLALGGLIVGLLSLFTPAVWGNGYSTVQSF
ncbi:voltage-gated ClC-type chloride channel ClcB [Escherichia coli]